MHRIGMRDHALRRPGLGRDHKIVAHEVELLQRGGHEGQISLIQFAGKRQAVDVGGDDLVAVDQRACALRVVNMREDVGLRKQKAEFLEHLLAAAHADEPIMNNRYAHDRTSHAIKP